MHASEVAETLERERLWCVVRGWRCFEEAISNGTSEIVRLFSVVFESRRGTVSEKAIIRPYIYSSFHSKKVVVGVPFKWSGDVRWQSSLKWGDLVSNTPVDSQSTAQRQ